MEHPAEDLLQGKSQLSKDLKDIATLAEYEAIIKVLREVKYNKTKAAEVLKIDRKTLYNKIRNYEEFISIKE
ncbi:MAG: helix-turn-helix domain-containing protein [Bacteroidota bacterium]